MSSRPVQPLAEGVATRREPAVPLDTAAGQSTRTRLRRGVVGLLLVYLALGLLHASVLPPFLLVDESAHAAYALTVADGDLPTIHTPIPTDGFPLLRERLGYDVEIGRPYRTDVWTANHPPLFYLLTAAPLRAGLELGQPLLGLWAARALNVALGAGVLVATVALARSLVPSRPTVALLAAGWLAVVPLFLTQPAAVYNDVLAALTATAALAAAVKLLRAGRTTFRGVSAVALWSSAAALTRVSGLLFAVIAAGLTAVAAAHGGDDEPARARLRRAVRDGGGVLAVVALASGWFYWRNAALHGGVTGRPGLLAKLDAEPGPGLWEVLADPGYWIANLWDVFAGVLPQGLIAESRFGLPRVAESDLVVWTVVAVLTTAVAGLVLRPLLRIPAVVRGAVKRGAPASLPGLATWGLLSGAVLAIVLASAQHVAHGGNPHGRYLLQVLPILAIMAATVWSGRAGRRGTHQSALPALGLVLAVNLVHWVVFVTTHYGPETTVVPALPTLAAMAAVPGAPVLLPLAAAALPIGIALYVGAFKGLAAAPDAGDGERGGVWVNPSGSQPARDGAPGGR